MDNGKARVGLVVSGFSNAIHEVSKVGTFGSKKYTDNGWKDVPDGFARYTDAMLRHFLAESKEDIDKESNLLHAAHLAWNALARLELLLASRNTQSEGSAQPQSPPHSPHLSTPEPHQL